MKTQSRPGAKVLASLVIAASVSLGVVGCELHPTTDTGSNGAGTISTSAEAHPLVDVEAVWATHPLPPCKDYLGTDLTVPPGISVPDYDSVAKELAGVKSTGSESWVRTKLGWLDRALSETRAGIIANAGTAGARAQGSDFELYVSHVRDELQLGRDTASDLDSTFIERCLP